MKKLFLPFIIAFSLLFSACTLHHFPKNNEEQAPIVILHTNDVHAGVDDHIGYAGLAAYKREMEEKYGTEHVILVDAGDAFQGTAVAMLTKGASIVELMNEVGYDYFVLGNHEFDYQLPRLFELAEDLDANIVSSNFIDLQKQTSVYAPYKIHTIGNIDIAFVGVTTPESLTKASSQYFQDDRGHFIYTFAEDENGEYLYDIVQKTIDEARYAGAEYVVALVHLGTDTASTPWRSYDLIANVSGIDIVLDGHSHSLIEGEIHQDKEGNTVVLSQTGTKLEYIGKILIDPNKKDGEDIVAELIDKNETTGKKDSAVEQKIDEINAVFKELLEKNVAYSEQDLIATQNNTSIIRMEETNLGDLVADAYRILLDTDVAIANGGGIRADLLKGDITFKDIIDIQPFGNYIISMEVSGKTLKNALEMGAKHCPVEDNGFLQVSGMTYEIDTSIPSSVQLDQYGNFVGVNGAYRVKNISIGGNPLKENTLYSVASHDFLLKNGGDGMTMFKNSKIIKDMFMTDNEVLIRYITEHLGGNIGAAYINPKGAKRITLLP